MLNICSLPTDASTIAIEEDVVIAEFWVVIDKVWEKLPCTLAARIETVNKNKESMATRVLSHPIT